MRSFITYFSEKEHTMSEYEIKIYEKGFEEAQAKLGTDETQDWIDFGQTTADRLKEYYSAEDFDPETRLYAFKDGELVSFIVSRILPDAEDGIKRAQHDFPLYTKGNEKAAELLYEKAVKVLKKKGVQVLEARVGKGWLGTLDLAEKHGYKKARVSFMRIELEFDDIKVKEAKVKYENFYPEKDNEQIVQMFKDQFNFTDEQAETNYKGIVNPPEGWYAMPVLREGDKIISRGLLYIQPEPNQENAIFRPLIPDPEKHFDSYLSMITKIAKEKGAKRFQMYLGGPNLNQKDFFKSVGFDVKGKVLIFEKEI